MYINSEKYIDKEQREKLSVLLGNIHYSINSYGKWHSTEDRRLDYTSSDFEIIYYSKGGAKIIIDGKEYKCCEGSMLILEPYSLVTTINEGYKEYEYFYIYFDIEPAYLQTQLSNMLISNGPVIQQAEYSELRGMFEKLFLETERKDIGYISIIVSGLLRIIVEIIRVQQKRKPMEINPVKYTKQQVEVVNSAINYITQHKNDPLKMHELSKYIGVSNSYLYKAFVEVMGIAPSKYIIQFKIKKAKELLKSDEYSVEEIGNMLGFSSPYHFSNTFKAITGISPKKYELSIRNIEW